uniref:ZP domain-containing protein n=1 Tax=Elaeophora elaphi TaxID=1147741 RepID=A0A0R3RGI7_9BILA
MPMLIIGDNNARQLVFDQSSFLFPKQQFIYITECSFFSADNRALREENTIGRLFADFSERYFTVKLHMDDDIVDLLVVSGVAAIGLIALIYLVVKIYSDKINKHLLCFKKKTKHLVAISNVALPQHPKSILTSRKFSEVDQVHPESSGKILIRSTEPLKKQSTKRVRIEVEDKLDSKSPSFNSSKIKPQPCTLLSSIVNVPMQRRKTL